MMAAAVILSVLSGFLAGVVVCRTWRLSLSQDLVLASLSVAAMLGAAHLTWHIDAPAVFVVAVVGYFAAAAVGSIASNDLP